MFERFDILWIANKHDVSSTFSTWNNPNHTTFLFLKESWVLNKDGSQLLSQGVGDFRILKICTREGNNLNSPEDIFQKDILM